jgi:GNAT superfamily N-acetyltransferase
MAVMRMQPALRTVATMKPFTVHVQIGPVPPYAPAVIALCAEQQEALERRYDGDHAYLERHGLDPSISFLVARIDGEPVGCAGLQLLEPGMAEIRRMYIRPAHRGQGVSRLLLTALEGLAREWGVLTLRLETGDLQPESISLYQSSGYRRIPAFGPYVGSTHSLCFEKHLHLQLV